jgi:competence protein ComEC
VQQRLGLGRRAGQWGLRMPAVPRWTEPLEAHLLAERDRWLLWLPVCLGLGIAAFFSLPAQPPLATGFVAILLATAASFLAWRASRTRAALARAGWVALATCLAGFALAQARLEAVQAPVLLREATYDVTGRVAALEPRGRGVRLTLDQLTLSRVPPEATPRLVRLTLARGGDELAPGDRIRLRARLQPPQPPALPGGFDYARQAYFEQLGGLGYAMGTPEILAASADEAGGIAALRARIARRIAEIVPGAAGAFAAAMIAGVRAAIDNETWRAFQVSGLAHLISISGLHMTLVAGTVFLAARFVLALIPWLALRIRVHKPAAVLAWAATAFYALLAGNTVPTQRSFLMVTVAVLAVLVDRNPFSLRVLAWAAIVVLALRPEALFGASFQLSFAAVLALIATYETFRLRALGGEGETGVLGHAMRYVLGVAATTLIASSATAPFAAYHFQNVATYGVLANLIAVPLTSFIVMPAGLLGLALMPLGLDRPAFQLMGLGSEAVLETARLVADLPGASVAVAQWPVAALVLAILGGLWLALWRRRWRLFGLLPCAAAFLLVLLRPLPDLVVDLQLGAAARRLPDGGLLLLAWERDARQRESWMRALGAHKVAPGPLRGGEAHGVACDAQACLVQLAGATISLSRTAGAAIEDCGQAQLVIARAGPERCRSGARVIGPRALRASGGLVLRTGSGGIVVETVAESRGEWPWSRSKM